MGQGDDAPGVGARGVAHQGVISAVDPPILFALLLALALPP